MSIVEKVSLKEKFASFRETYVPKIIGELNGQYVKAVKFEGPYVWHHHEHEDEMFLVTKGRLRILFRDQEVALDEGEFCIVPRGVEHKPVADEICEAILFEPASTVNTGNAEGSAFTKQPEELDRI